jgi:hypothetical protein
MSRAHDIWEKIGETKPYTDWFLEQLEVFAAEHDEVFHGAFYTPVTERVRLFYVWLEERYAKS